VATITNELGISTSHDIICAFEESTEADAAFLFQTDDPADDATAGLIPVLGMEEGICDANSHSDPSTHKLEDAAEHPALGETSRLKENIGVNDVLGV